MSCKAFVKESAQAGIDLFRIFDSLNWVPNMQAGDRGGPQHRHAVRGGHLLHRRHSRPARPKYDLKYYVELAKELEKLGANMLAIKDMAGLCKPYAARQLVKALKQEIGIPIHFHTHDSGGGQMAAVLMAAEEDVDIVDAAMAPFSGLTSQVNLNTMVESLRFTPRDTGADFDALASRPPNTGRRSAAIIARSKAA